MKVIVAGGRDLEWEDKYYDLLDSLAKKYNFTEIVSGCATGADSF